MIKFEKKLGDMKDDNIMNSEQRNFYGIYADQLEKCQQIMVEEINSIIDSLTDDPETKPSEHILSRIKGGESLMAKLELQGLDKTIETGFEKLSDLVGCRIVTHFVGDIYSILEQINKSDKWEVVQVKDYIKNSKPNGYRSLHIILRMPFGVNGIETIDTEIQMRTIAMDCWAALEHQLKYKKKIENVDFITEQLKRCSDEMASTDLSMESIRELLSD